MIIGYNEKQNLILDDPEWTGEPWEKTDYEVVEIKCTYCSNTIIRRFNGKFTCDECKAKRYSNWTKKIKPRTCTICRDRKTLEKYCYRCTKKLFKI